MINIKIIDDANGFILNETLSTGLIIVFALLILAVFGTFYALRSIGIYMLAKRQGIDKAFIAFIPFLWMYTLCKLVGNTRVFGYSLNKLAIWFTVLFALADLLPVVYDSFTILPYVFRYLQGENIEIVFSGSGYYIEPELVLSNGIIVLLRIVNVVSRIAELAQIFITITVYIALFKTFWPEHYILASVLSFLGLFPIFAFAIRNRKAVDFNEYIRNRYYGAGYTPYGNGYYGGYNGGAAQNGNNGHNANNGAEDNEPFGEFSDRPEEPFGEFSDNKKNTDDKDDFFS